MSLTSAFAAFIIFVIIILFTLIARLIIQADHALSQIEDNSTDLSDYPLYKD